jgi:hypothetical protein
MNLCVFDFCDVHINRSLHSLIVGFTELVRFVQLYLISPDLVLMHIKQSRTNPKVALTNEIEGLFTSY